MVAVGVAAAKAPARAPDGRLELSVVDAASGEPIPARIHLRDGRGRPVKTRGWGLAALGDHAYLDGPTELGLRRGAYRFDLDAGPEYRTRAGHFTIERHADDAERVEMRRFANLASEGWIGGDLQSARSTDALPLLGRASQTAVASRVGVRWDDGGWETVDRRAKGLGPDALWVDPRGAVWLVDPRGDLTTDDLPAFGASSITALAAARQRGWKVLAAIDSRELPLWLAHGVVDAVVVIDGWADSGAGKHEGRPRDKLRFPGRRGAGRWREWLYHRLAEAGLRTPPVAGSGSGLNKSPFAAAAVYVAAGPSAAWWDRLADGAAVVTNGPLLRPSIGGEPPGTTFFLDGQGPLELEVGLNLATREPVDYLEILKNGEVAHSLRLAEWAAAGGRAPMVSFDAPGWLAVRAVADVDGRYRFALTAPYWVEADGPRVASDSVGFFREWLADAAERFGADAADDYAAADRFWAERADSATD